MLKFAAILDEITVSEIFGAVLAFVWRVEWQVSIYVLYDDVIVGHDTSIRLEGFHTFTCCSYCEIVCCQPKE
jgi:hypothetical protein